MTPEIEQRLEALRRHRGNPCQVIDSVIKDLTLAHYSQQAQIAETLKETGHK